MIELRAISADLRVSDGEVPHIVGYAVPFGALSIDLGGFRETFSPGAFKRSLQRTDIDVLALWNHNLNMPLGRRSRGTLDVREDENGLAVEILPGRTSWQLDAVEAVRRGDVQGMSFKFRAVSDRVERRNGELVRVVDEALLYEVSPTADPAYPQTTAQIRSMEEIYKNLAERGAATPDKKERTFSLELAEAYHRLHQRMKGAF